MDKMGSINRLQRKGHKKAGEGIKNQNPDPG